ncbi:MAG: hypothetical protein LC792_04645, partial [Actinobacteria bacterium]|nr:hypothetical protein [Actinomycetota bacterium]
CCAGPAVLGWAAGLLAGSALAALLAGFLGLALVAGLAGVTVAAARRRVRPRSGPGTPVVVGRHRGQEDT